MKYFFGIKKSIFFPLAMLKMKEHKRLEGRNTSEQKNNFFDLVEPRDYSNGNLCQGRMSCLVKQRILFVKINLVTFIVFMNVPACILMD